MLLLYVLEKKKVHTHFRYWMCHRNLHVSSSSSPLAFKSSQWSNVACGITLLIALRFSMNDAGNVVNEMRCSGSCCSPCWIAWYAEKRGSSLYRIMSNATNYQKSDADMNLGYTRSSWLNRIKGRFRFCEQLYIFICHLCYFSLI